MGMLQGGRSRAQTLEIWVNGTMHAVDHFGAQARKLPKSSTLKRRVNTQFVKQSWNHLGIVHILIRLSLSLRD